MKTLRYIIIAIVALSSRTFGQDASRWERICPAGPRAGSVEALICADSALRGFDATLEAFYVAALAQSKQPAALRQRQRRWLRDVRGRCGAKECLARAYRRRVLELQDDLLASTVPAAAPMDAKSAEAICRSVATLADTGKLGERFLPPLPVEILQSERPALASIGGAPFAQISSEIHDKTYGQPDGVVIRIRTAARRPPVAFGDVSTGGSCPSAELWNLEYLMAAIARGEKEPSTFLAPEDTKDGLGGNWWGAHDRAAFVDGRPLVVTISYANPDLVNLVSWIRPDGRVQPLCSMSYDTHRVLDVAHSPDRACASVEGEIERGPDWQPLDPMNVELKTRDGAGDTYGNIDTAEWDLDGDGRPEVLARLQLDSGGGCGSHEEWLRLLDAKRTASVDTPLDEALAGLRAQRISVLRYEGRGYVDAFDSRFGGTTYRIEGSKPVAACRFSIRPYTRIDKTWVH